MSEERTESGAGIACECPNCRKPAIKKGNEIGCEHCDAVFEVRKKQATVKTEGLMERFVKLEKTVEELTGKLAPSEPPADPAGDADGGKPNSDPWDWEA